jgi:phosphoribosylanthranilate isomerase
MEISERINIKICGMRDELNIMQTASFAPEYMGFIFYASSPRFVGNTFEIPASLASSIRRVGVFVNETTDVILQKSRQLGIDHIQLHGNESTLQAAQLRDAGLKVIKVFSVDDAFNFMATKPYVPVVDYFLFDTKGKHYGGNAKTFNWEILKHYDQEIPFFLSGGLTPENVQGVHELKGMNLHAVDVNSGVEQAPGMKSAEKLHVLFEKLSHKSIGNDL